MLCILPFEVEFFAKHNYKVHYVGNPTVDAINEREYKNKPTIVISDIAKDSGDHIYYDHERVSKYIQCCVSVQNSSGLIHRVPSSPLQKITPTVPASVSASTSASSCERTSRPLANLLKSKDRSKLIEENAKNAI